MLVTSAAQSNPRASGMPRQVPFGTKCITKQQSVTTLSREICAELVRPEAAAVFVKSRLIHVALGVPP